MRSTVKSDHQLIADISACIAMLDKLEKKHRETLWDESLDLASNNEYADLFDGILYISLYLDTLEIWHRISTGHVSQRLLTPFSSLIKLYSYAHHYLATPLNENLSFNISNYLTFEEISKLFATIKTLNISYALPIAAIKSKCQEQLQLLNRCNENNDVNLPAFYSEGLFPFFMAQNNNVADQNAPAAQDNKTQLSHI